MNPATFEKLGQFYLGKPYDLEAGALADGVTLYDARDLTTHAVCVGMTGSGKTGLCVALLEEAALDGIPALVVDPKGDLANLLLTFPDLAPGDFAPWVDADEARRKGLSEEEFARAQATLWRSGLADWSQDGERIARLKSAAEFAVFTPGSTAGTPVSILASFAAPPPGVRDDAELLGDRIESTVTSLLALVDVDADPLRSREHILLSTILRQAWRQGLDLDLEGLIHRIQNPGVQRIGVMELESFFPSRDRFALAMTLNNLLAAPGFETWMQGVPLDVDRLLHTRDGRPRVAVLSIAHLSDAERMFFVSLLLNETLGWMRGQSGTTSLRALLYIDEIFGFMPPVAAPPSKKPLLTLLKQARAFGLGVVLATQNPVDLDYKGLSNCGTWFVGRLQTERDKARLLDGLEGASAEGGTGLDRSRVEDILSGLGKRVFLLHNVHEDAPTVFHTRWVMSYLRGPLTRDQIRTLRASLPDSDAGVSESGAGPLAAVGSSASGSGAPAAGPGDAAPSAAAAGPEGDGTGAEAGQAGRPVLPPDVPQVFVRPRSDVDGGQLRYVPAVLGVARVAYHDARKGVDHTEEVTLLAIPEPGDPDLDWESARPFRLGADQLADTPLEGAAFGALPPLVARGKSYAGWTRDLRDHLYRNRALVLFRSETADELSRPGEEERTFRVRLSEVIRERRDEGVDALRRKFQARIDRAEEAVRRAEAALDTQKDQASRARMDGLVSVGESLLSAFVGGRRRGGMRRASRAARGMSRSAKEARDVDRAEETLERREEKVLALETELREEVAELHHRFDPTTEPLRTVRIQPRQRDVDVRRVALAWVPVRRK